MRVGRRTAVIVLCAILLSIPCLAGCEPRVEYVSSKQPVTLRFLVREQTAVMETLVAEFHARYPWITVEMVRAEQFSNQMDALIQTGDIDIFRDGREGLLYAEQGLLAPLDEVQLGDWSGIHDDYYPGAWEGLRLNGQQLGIPAGLDLLVTYVHLDHANALKVAIPDVNWTNLEFLELVTKLNYPEGLPNTESAKLFGFCSDPRGVDPLVFIYSHGGTVVDSITAPSQVTLNAPATVEAIQWYSDLFNTHRVAPLPDVLRSSFARGGVWEASFRGACGVWLGWYSMRGGFDERMEWHMKWKMLPLPKDRTGIGLGDVEAYYLMKDCEHPKEALKLLRFLADRWEASDKMLPPRRSLADSEAYQEAVGEELATVASMASAKLMMLPSESSAALDKVSEEFTAAVVQIVEEDYLAEQILDEAQAKVKNVFKQP